MLKTTSGSSSKTDLSNIMTFSSSQSHVTVPLIVDGEEFLTEDGEAFVSYLINSISLAVQSLLFLSFAFISLSFELFFF